MVIFPLHKGNKKINQTNVPQTAPLFLPEQNSELENIKEALNQGTELIQKQKVIFSAN